MTADRADPQLLDCDLLIGHDILTGRWAQPDTVREMITNTGVSGGLVSSLRSVHFDARSGNEEAEKVAASYGWYACPALDLRDPLGAERELDRLLSRAASLRPRAIRLAPGQQGIEPGFPAFSHVVQLLADAGLTIFVEGDVRTVSAPFRGLGASVVFLDTHFYHLGDFVILARNEPLFRTSTRMLTGPDSLEIVADEVGADRLLLGCRAPFHEARSVVRRLLTSKLPADQIALVGSLNLTNLLEPV